MRTDLNEMILTTYGMVEEEFEDKSTEFVIQMTADRSGATYEQVVNALTKQGTTDDA